LNAVHENGRVYFSKGVALSLLAAVAIGVNPAQAQDRYRLTFKGTASSVDASGNENVRSITDKALIQEWAGRAGTTDFKNLALAFHRDVDGRGDAIEIVNRKDGSFVTTVFPLYFPQSASVTTPKGTTQKRFAYVFNLHQAEFSRGTAVLNQQTIVNKKGQTNRFVTTGEMQWYQLPEGTNGLRICSGTFKVSKPIK
jgi:hypothetical protein